MAEFVYNNVKNTSTSYIPFKLNRSYYLYESFEDKVEPCLKSYLVDKLVIELRELI